MVFKRFIRQCACVQVLLDTFQQQLQQKDKAIESHQAQLDAAYAQLDQTQADLYDAQRELQSNANDLNADLACALSLVAAGNGGQARLRSPPSPRALRASSRPHLLRLPAGKSHAAGLGLR